MQMFKFANFVQKIDFGRSRFQKLVVALSEIYLLELSQLWLLRESYFKAPKLPVDE